MSGVSPESRAAGVSFRVDTGPLGTLSLYFVGKLVKELFYQAGPMENPSFSVACVFILKTRGRQCKEKRSEDVRGKDVESFCSVKTPYPH